MLKEQLKECVDYAFEKANKLLLTWNDYSMQQIRLDTANRRRIEENRQRHIEEMNEKRKHERKH